MVVEADHHLPVWAEPCIILYLHTNYTPVFIIVLLEHPTMTQQLVHNVYSCVACVTNDDTVSVLTAVHTFIACTSLVPRLPDLFNVLVYVEKIGEPGDEAKHAPLSL